MVHTFIYYITYIMNTCVPKWLNISLILFRFQNDIWIETTFHICDIWQLVHWKFNTYDMNFKIAGKKVSYFVNKTYWYICIWNLPDRFKKSIFYGAYVYTAYGAYQYTVSSEKSHGYSVAGRSAIIPTYLSNYCAGWFCTQ